MPSSSESSVETTDLWQERVELFTYNDRGQITTRTDSEGNVTAYVRFPENDPEGDGRFVSATLSSKQYGRVKEEHVDVDPEEVMTLVGADGDLLDFTPDAGPRGTRTNTPGQYLDLVTRYGPGTASGGAGCATCGGSGPGAGGGGGAYDALGNPLSVTDPRGFTTTHDYDEMGRLYRTTAPAPYLYQTEIHHDANGNVIRTDTEDKEVDFRSDDPTDARYAHFFPSGNTQGGAATAHVPTRPGPGGEIRPGWFVHQSEYDLLDRKTLDDVEATGSDPDYLVTRYAYDPNGNLIRTTRPLGNTIAYDYDERNLRIAERAGFVPSTDTEPAQPGAVTVHAFDRNGNLVITLSPSDRVPDALDTALTVTLQDAFRSGAALVHRGTWVTENVYDGFDRLIQTIDALGNTTTFTHDPGGRVIETAQAGPIGGPSPTDRSGMNNVPLAEALTCYDEAGQAYEQQQQVFLPEGVTIPSSRTITFTPGGLAANSEANDHTETVDLTDEEASYLLTRTEFDRNGRVVASITDNTATTLFTFDGAGRQLTATDPLGNRTENTFDAGGNVIATTRIEKCTITFPEVADEVFRSAMRYDALGRLVVQAHQGADGSLQAELDFTDPDKTLFSLFGYDSRGNRTLVIDPKGNTVETVFDGASRPLETIQHLRQRGEGTEPPAANRTLDTGGEAGGAVVTRTVYDANGNTAALIDDHGNTTTYRYDEQDRLTIMTFPDGSSRTTIYDEAGDELQFIDENGALFDYHLDALGRRVRTAITPAEAYATGVQTLEQTWQYDGLSRITRSQDIAADPATSSSSTSSESSSETPAALVQCDLLYDSLGRVIEESQMLETEGSPVTRYATNHVFFSHVIAGITYPNGRQIENTFDALYRRTAVADAADESSSSSSSEEASFIAQWEFFGNRQAEVRLGNGLVCTWMNNTRTHSAVQAANPLPAWGTATSDRLGYDGAGRMITKRYISGELDEFGAYTDTTPVVGFTTRFDKASNKFFERTLHAENRSSLYIPLDAEGQPTGGIDSLNRLLQYQRGNLAAGGSEITDPLTLPNADASRTYDLDHLGNWKKSAFEPSGDPLSVDRRNHNALNQITRRQAETAAPWVTFAYDLNGNLLDDGQRLMRYDALNRLIEVKRKSDEVIISRCLYDVDHRLVQRMTNNGGLDSNVPDQLCDYIYLPQTWQEAEIYTDNVLVNPSPTLAQQFVWGTYIDELLQLKLLKSAGPQELASGLYYPTQDLLYRTLSLTNDMTQIVEAYDYDAYGNTLIFIESGTNNNWWSSDAVISLHSANNVLFCGYRYECETKLYISRLRYYSPDIGRWIQKDPLGIIDGFNLYNYSDSNPTIWIDPTGTQKYTLLDKTFPFTSHFVPLLVWFNLNIDIKIEVDVRWGVPQNLCPAEWPSNIKPTWDYDIDHKLTGYDNHAIGSLWIGARGTRFDLRAGVEYGFKTYGRYYWSKAFNLQTVHGTFFDMSISGQKWLPSFKGMPCACLELTGFGNIHGQTGIYHVRFLTLVAGALGIVGVSASAPVSGPVAVGTFATASAIAASINAAISLP